MNLSDIDVVILCGGKGTRLSEETSTKPKPMVKIGEQPLLWHIMKYYSCFGFRRFILALGYKEHYIKKYFLDYRLLAGDLTVPLNPNSQVQSHSSGNEHSWEVVCVDTGLETLKGGRIKRLASHIKGENFHLTYGDGLSTVDLKALHHFHLKHGKIATVTAVRPPSRFGEMTLEGDRVVNFEEKPQLTTGYINGGFFIFQKKFLDLLSKDINCDLEFGVLQSLAQDRELMTFKHEGYWQCMDTRRDLDYLNKLWTTQAAPWKIWKSQDDFSDR